MSSTAPDNLITGGAGFIGSHLAETLLNTGQPVTVIDDLSTGRIENIQHLLNHPNFTFVQDTVRNAETMHILIEKCTRIFHLAAAVGVQLIVERPVHTIETNIHGTEVVLNVANKFRRKVLLASTSEVYGKSNAVPFNEDDDSVFGSTRFSRWSYACSKAIDEFLGLAYHQQYQLPVIVVRLFNTVGPRQTGQYGMVVPRFIERALQNKPIQIYGTGNQTRCFSYVGDVVQALIKLIDSDISAGSVFNVGSTQEISINQLADQIISLTCSKSTKEYLSYEQAYGRPFDDMMRRMPCLDRLYQTTGYKPETPLKDILQSVITHIKSAHNSSQAID